MAGALPSLFDIVCGGAGAGSIDEVSSFVTGCAVNASCDVEPSSPTDAFWLDESTISVVVFVVFVVVVVVVAGNTEEDVDG